MKNLFILAALITALPAGYSFAGGGGTPANFSGAWVLDMNKTHDVPARLQSYKMNVTQTDSQFTVKTRVEGEFTQAEGPGGEGGGPGYPQGGGYPEGRQRGGGYPGGGGGYPGGGGGLPGGGGGLPGGGFPGGVGFPGGQRGGGYPGGPGGRGPGARSEQMRRAMAFSMVTPVASYNLDGTTTTMPIDKPIPGSTTLKAGWKKSGSQLDLSRVEDLNGSERTIKIQEQWTLSKDGRDLEVERHVDTPRGSTKIKMIFSRDEASSVNTQK
jgi:hypothetical protein